MSGQYAAGLVAAVAAAGCYGAAPVAQAVAARSAPPGSGVGLGLALRLVRRPIWLLGFLAEIGAFGLEAYAFSAAPATLVAPVASCDLVVFLLLGALLLGARPSALARWGIAAMSGGAVLLALSLSGDAPLGRPATTTQLLVGLGGCAVLVGVCALAGQRAVDARRPATAASAFSLGSGLAYGVATVATRQIGRTFDPDHWWRLLTTPTPYVLAGCSVLAIAMMQRGLQTSALLTYPTTSAVSAFLPVVVGASLLDDPVPAGLALAGFVAGLVLVGAGVVLTAREHRP